MPAGQPRNAQITETRAAFLSDGLRATVLIVAGMLTAAPCLAAQAKAQKPESGSIAQLDVGELAGDATARIEAWLDRPDLRGVLIVQIASPAAPPAAAPVVLLTNGDRLAVRSIEIADDLLTSQADSDDLGAIPPFPLEFVRGVVLATGVEDQAEFTPRRFESQVAHADVLWLGGTDRLTGELRSLSQKQASVQTPSGTVDVAASRIRAIAMNHDLWNRSRRPALRASLVLNDGSLLSLKTVRMTAQGLVGKWLTDRELAIPRSLIARLTLYGDNAVPLSFIAPAVARNQPFLPGPLGESGTDGEAFVVDRTIRHGLLRVNGRVRPCGLGVSSGTSLTFLVPPGAATFATMVGIDDEAGTAGSVIFEILADDQVVWSSPVMTGGQAPATVEIDVTGRRRLVLRTRYGPDGDILDMADWCEPVFLGDGMASLRSPGT